MIKTPAPWKRQILLFFTSQCITLLGSQIVQMAIVWHVTLTTSSGAWVAAFSLCSYLPQFFVSFWGGALADRRSRKLLIIGADALIALVTLIMLLLMPRIENSDMLLIALLIMSAIRSAGSGIQSPAVNAVIPQLVPQEHLLQYNGINAAMQSLVQFAAPAAAAVILTSATLRSTLLIDVVTAAIGIGLLARIPLPICQTAQETPPLAHDLFSGLRYACSHATVLHALIIYALFMFLTVPAGYLSGLLVSRVYGDTYWHLTAVELAGFGGMMAGGLLMSLWSGFNARRLTLAAGLTLFGVMAAAMGLSRSFIPYLVFMILYGVALTMVQTTVTTLLQESTESSMQGRVFGLMGSLYASFYPLGMALFGPMSDRVPIQFIMILSGAALLTLACTASCDRHLNPSASIHNTAP